MDEPTDGEEQRENFKALFRAVEQQVQASLSEARAGLKHGGAKGSRVEEGVRRAVRRHLPGAYRVGHGEVIDSQGRRSAQSDLIVTNSDHPFTYDEDTPGLYVIEGVAAVGEIKANLTSDELTKAIENSARFKRLRAHPGQGTLAHSNPSDLARFYSSPPWFLLSLESQLTVSTVARRFEESGADSGDAFFLLDRGIGIDFGDGEGAFKYDSGDGKKTEGWRYHEVGNVLFTLFAWLTSVMPRPVRFEPILPRYLLGFTDEE